MISELRWTLLLLGLLFIAVLIVWELRRARSQRERSPLAEVIQSPPAAGDSTLILPQMRAREPLAAHELPVMDPLPVVEAREALVPVPVLEPAPENAEQGPPADAPPEAWDTPEMLEFEPATVVPPVAMPEPIVVPAAATLPRESLPTLPAPPEPKVDWPPDPERRVLALRLVAVEPERFAGRLVRQALSAEGFVLGRFDIFHKPDDEQRAVLSAASLTRPGTFDVDTMDSQHYGGLSLFAVLPGPKAPPEAFDELVFTARSLNARLCGMLQDEGGTPLTPARVAALRDRLGIRTPS